MGFKKNLVIAGMMVLMFILGASFNAVSPTTSAVSALDLEPSTGFDANDLTAAFCPPGQSSSTIFYDDFESGSGDWLFTAMTGSNAWSLDSTLAHSGAYSLQADGRQSYSDSVAEMRFDVALPGLSRPYLWFAHDYDFEAPNFDGGFFEYSTDSGATWLDGGRFIDNGHTYDGTIYSAILGGNPNGSHRAFLASSHGFVPTRVDLSRFQGGRIRFRWHQSTDENEVGGRGGWWLDDVRIYTCSVLPTPTDASLLSLFFNPPPTETATPQPTPTRRHITFTPTYTPLPNISRTPTRTPTKTATPKPTNTPKPPTVLPTVTQTRTPVPTNTPLPTNTLPPTITHTLMPSSTPISPTLILPSSTPILPTSTPIKPTSTPVPPTDPPADTETPVASTGGNVYLYNDNSVVASSGDGGGFRAFISGVGRFLLRLLGG